ncbi:MAG: hypothetical protein ACTSQE_09115 [Candidatus Heimdallarchaeaceae archaeon]
MLDSDTLSSLNLKEVRRLFRNGLEVREKNNTIQELEKLGLIELKIVNYVKCVNRQDGDFLELTESQKLCDGRGIIVSNRDTVECTECDRTLYIDEKIKYKNYRIILNNKKIIETIIDRLKNLNIKIKQRNSYITYSDENKDTYRLCFLDICEDLECKTDFYYSDDTLYVAFDVVEIIDSPNVIWFFDLIIKNDKELNHFLKSKMPQINSKKISNIMYQYIDNSTWESFEDFIPQLLNYISKNPNNLNHGFALLEKYSGTIISSFHVEIGGSSNPDAYQINILEYFKEVLNNKDKYIEVKHSQPHKIYETRISTSDFRQFYDHVDQGRGVLFSNRCKVDPYIWSRIVNIREKRGYWQIIVINRPLLILFISLFAKDFWDKPEITEVNEI